MGWLKNIFGSNNKMAITVNGVNPQTDNEFLFYEFIERELPLYLKAWYSEMKQSGESFKPQYIDAINQKIKTGSFKNPHTFPEYFKSKFDYIAIDFETANNNRISACALGLAFVKNNKFVFTDKFFIQPPKREKFLNSHSLIHGIYKEDVEFAFTFQELWDLELSKYFNSNLIVFHNASMDLSILRNLFQYYKIDNFNIDYLDTMKLAKATQNPTKLMDLAKLFNIEVENHHDPESDAETCADVFDELKKQYPNYSELIGNLNSLSKEGKTEKAQVSTEIKNENIDYIKEYSITKTELDRLEIQNHSFIFTGELVEDREACKQFIIQNGGLIKSGITSKVNYVVIGTGYGWSKIQKIHELNTTKKCKIRILSNSNFNHLVKKYSI
tara:strand:- start:381 stop:1535 length:1155 start_codon:yes stop_codon:yes gene_type:complete